MEELSEDVINKKIEEMEWAEREHKDGLHDTFQENCYDCYKEARLIKAKKTVGRNDNYPPDVLRHLLD